MGGTCSGGELSEKLIGISSARWIETVRFLILTKIGLVFKSIATILVPENKPFPLVVYMQ